MLDLSAVFSSVLASLVQVWYLIPLVLIILFFKSPFGKGLLGEMLVNFAVNVRLDKQIYHLIKTSPFQQKTAPPRLTILLYLNSVFLSLKRKI